MPDTPLSGNFTFPPAPGGGFPPILGSPGDEAGPLGGGSGVTSLENLIEELLFGTGSDGDVTITGTTTLTRDMHYEDLTIAVGGILEPNGFRVFCSHSLTNLGTIRSNGSNGSDAGGGGGAGGAGAGRGTLGGGGTGGNGGTDGGAGSTPGTGNGGFGGAGGAGGAVGGSAGGTATNVWSDTPSPIVVIAGLEYYDSTVLALAVGGGGGGGGEDNGPSDDGGGGGGGGGLILICAPTFRSSGTIQANGGSGGSGGTGGAGGDGGGGGGGGGGALLVVTRESTTLAGTRTYTGGTGGGGGTSDPGSNGSNGAEFIIQVEL